MWPCSCWSRHPRLHLGDLMFKLMFICLFCSGTKSFLWSKMRLTGLFFLLHRCRTGRHTAGQEEFGNCAAGSLLYGGLQEERPHVYVLTVWRSRSSRDLQPTNHPPTVPTNCPQNVPASIPSVACFHQLSSNHPIIHVPYRVTHHIHHSPNRPQSVPHCFMSLNVSMDLAQIFLIGRQHELLWDGIYVFMLVFTNDMNIFNVIKTLLLRMIKSYIVIFY